MTSRIVGILLALVLATSAVASTDAPVSLRELYRSSTVVAVVEVLEGQAVAAGGNSCGSRYRGRVIEGTKKATAGQIIEFGFVSSLKTGAWYFVLLDDYENVPLEGSPEFQPRCKNVLPGLALVGLRRGVMEVTPSGGEPMRRDAWTIRRASFVEYPIGTRSTWVDGERQLVFTDMVGRMMDESPVSR